MDANSERITNEAKIAIDKLVRIQTLIISGAIQTDIAGKISAKFDTFSTWLLAGFGAGIALLLTAQGNATLVPVGAVKLDAELFVWAVVVTVLQKYFAVVVSAASEASDTAALKIKEHYETQRKGGQKEDFNLPLFLADLLKAVNPMAKVLVGIALKRVARGDLTFGARLIAWLSQVQGVFVVAEVTLLLVAVGTIVRSLP